MSANDKAAAPYGRQPMTTAETLAKHRFEEETRCICGWDVPVADSYEEECRTWEAHQAAMLEPLIVGREQEASRQALNDAARELERFREGVLAEIEEQDPQLDAQSALWLIADRLLNRIRDARAKQ